MRKRLDARQRLFLSWFQDFTTHREQLIVEIRAYLGGDYPTQPARDERHPLIAAMLAVAQAWGFTANEGRELYKSLSHDDQEWLTTAIETELNEARQYWP